METNKIKSKTDNTVITNGVIVDNCFYPAKNLPSGTLRIILNTGCNFKCIYCFAEGEINKEIRILDIERLKKVLMVAKEFGISKIKLTGGEPLLYPFLEELLEYLQENFEYVDMTTNASLLSDEKIDLLNRYGVKAITVSLNTLNECRFAKLSMTEHFGSVLSNLHNAMSKYEGSIRINCVVFDDIGHLQDYHDVIAFCRDSGLGMRIIEPSAVEGMPLTEGKENFHKLLEELKLAADKIISSDCASVEYLIYGDWYITVMHSLCDNKLCDVCKNYMYIRVSSEMKLKPCLSRRDTEIAINTDSVSDIRKAFVRAIYNIGIGPYCKGEKAL